MVKMTFIEEVARQIKRLRANPSASSPAFRIRTPDLLHLSKMKQRAYDAARLELKLTSASELQRKNAAVTVSGAAPVVIRFAQYVSPAPTPMRQMTKAEVRRLRRRTVGALKRSMSAKDFAALVHIPRGEDFGYRGKKRRGKKTG